MKTQHTPGLIVGKTIVVRKDNRIVGFWIPSEFKVRKQTISFYDEDERPIEKILEDTEEWFLKKSAPGHELSIETIQIQSSLEATAPELLEALEEIESMKAISALPEHLHALITAMKIAAKEAIKKAKGE